MLRHKSKNPPPGLPDGGRNGLFFLFVDLVFGLVECLDCLGVVFQHFDDVAAN